MCIRDSPRALAVAAGVDHEPLEPGVTRVRNRGLALDVVGVPLVGQGPGGEVGRRGRVVLATAPVEVAVAPRPGVGRKPQALRDPGAVLDQVRVDLVVRDVQEEAVGLRDAREREALGRVTGTPVSYTHL